MMREKAILKQPLGDFLMCGFQIYHSEQNQSTALESMQKIDEIGLVGILASPSHILCSSAAAGLEQPQCCRPEYNSKLFGPLL